jgi:hypothetical protein
MPVPSLLGRQEKTPSPRPVVIALRPPRPKHLVHALAVEEHVAVEQPCAGRPRRVLPGPHCKVWRRAVRLRRWLPCSLLLRCSVMRRRLLLRRTRLSRPRLRRCARRPQAGIRAGGSRPLCPCRHPRCPRSRGRVGTRRCCRCHYQSPRCLPCGPDVRLSARLRCSRHVSDRVVPRKPRRRLLCCAAAEP